MKLWFWLLACVNVVTCQTHVRHNIHNFKTYPVLKWTPNVCVLSCVRVSFSLSSWILIFHVRSASPLVSGWFITSSDGSNSNHCLLWYWAFNWFLICSSFPTKKTLEVLSWYLCQNEDSNYWGIVCFWKLTWIKVSFHFIIKKNYSRLLHDLTHSSEYLVSG